MKISQFSSYAVQLLLGMSKSDSKHLSANALSDLTNIPLPTVSKILKLLTKDGLISSVLGAGGGYFLNKTANDITLNDVINAIEGPLKITPCVDDECETCEDISTCLTKGRWSSVNDHVLKSLSAIKLVDLAGK